MSDYRGPTAGMGDEPPDVAPRTGPPTGPARASQSDPGTAPPAESAAAAAPEHEAKAETESEAELPPEQPATPTNEPASEATDEVLPEARPDTGTNIEHEATRIPEPAVILTPGCAPEQTAAAAEPTLAGAEEVPPAEKAAVEPETASSSEPANEAELGHTLEPLAIPAPSAAPETPEGELAAASTALAEAPPPILVASAPTAVQSAPLPPPSLWSGRLRRAALILAALAAGYVVLVLALIVAYRWIDPPRSALMLATRLSGQPVLYAPVPITRISTYLQRAVVTSEDARFCYHRGIDWAALYEAVSESRGGSTITMQTAKNLFLWSSRSYIRKAIEIPVAMAIDALWPKRRILEVYLNIAEWGPGIFGAEAAAHYHFNKPASRLTVHEATLLAASLPNPIARDAGEPGRITSILASRLRARLGNSDAFVRCLGLRTTRPSRPAPTRAPRTEPKVPQKPAPKAAATKAEPKIPPWRTTTDPAFNPWQN